MKTTNIQWCHSTINPVMGCDGCELWKPAAAIGSRIAAFILQNTGQHDQVRNAAVQAVGNRLTSELYRDREQVSAELADVLGLGQIVRKQIVDIIRTDCKCYAGMLGTMRAGHGGYADAFEHPTLFPGRMAGAANWGRRAAAEIAHKPWLTGLRRLIFISDMGDALSSNITFEYLANEIIAHVASPAGQRHIWLWLTKRPQRMAEFGEWLLEHGNSWPANLMAMATVTSQGTSGRVDQLRQVPAQLKGLSVEPLFECVRLDLQGIDWVIVGGGSDALAERFEVEWALDLRSQCEAQGIAFFLKQLGRRPFFGGELLRLHDRHGGDWSEWPPQWRVRQMPDAFREGARPPAGRERNNGNVIHSPPHAGRGRC